MTTNERSIAALDALREQAGTVLALDLDLVWQRTSEWEKPLLPANGQRGGGTSAPSDDALEDRLHDRAASRYHDELRQLVKQLTADLNRLERIHGIVCPPQTRRLNSRDLQASQVATEGWCVSCWRDDKNCTPIALRPASGDAIARPYYKDRCRFCGAWKNEHGQDPPLPLLQKHHAGRHITTSDVEQALKK